MTKNFDERIIDRGFHTGYEVDYVTIPERDYEYLKYRDRLADDYEGENKRIRQMKYHEAYEQGKFDTNMKVWYEMPKLEQQSKRYREALEFYAEQDNYEWETSYRPQQEIDCMVIDDGGHTARKALEGEE